MGAQIQSAEHAEEYVRWAKFAPRGLRGFNTSGRDADYTHKTPAQFAVDANRDSFLAIQIETAGVLKDADQIAAIDGVDLLIFRRRSAMSASMATKKCGKQSTQSPPPARNTANTGARYRQTLGHATGKPRIRRKGHRARLPPAEHRRRRADDASRHRIDQGYVHQVFLSGPIVLCAG